MIIIFKKLCFLVVGHLFWVILSKKYGWNRMGLILKIFLGFDLLRLYKICFIRLLFLSFNKIKLLANQVKLAYKDS